MLEFPVDGQRLRSGNLAGGHCFLKVGEASVVLGERKPHVGQDVILWNSVALLVKIPQIVSSLPRTSEIGYVVGGFRKPVRRLDIVPFNAITVLIVHTQFILGVRQITFRGSLVPLKRLQFVRYAKPKILFEGHAEPELRFGDAFLGRAPQTSIQFDWILIGTDSADPIFRGSVTLFGRFLKPISGFLFIEAKKCARVVNSAEPVLRFRVA
jgi:hypothetical protein